jgi:fibronectin type 3 domain-containing protein
VRLPIQHSVDLSWNSSTSAVVGYNIYRATASGGPHTEINSFLDAAGSYTDASVQSGQNYFYVATAVDATGAESGYSNEVSAVVPTP